MANAYTLYAIAVGTDVIKQISSCRIDPGIQEMLVSGDSSLDNEHASLQTQEPIVRFTTTAITAALDLLGVGGLVIDEAGESNGVDLYFRRRAMGAGIADGDSHVKLTVNLGLMYPRILNVTHGGDPASIDGELACIYDGTNYPIVIAKNQALADLSPAINEVYTIGPWWVNDVRIALVQDLTVDFGLQTQAVQGDGDIWATGMAFHRREASMRCTSLDLPLLDDTLGLSIAGKARTGITRAFLRKKAAGGGLVPDTTAEHVKFEVAEGRINPQEFGGDHQEQMTLGLQVTPTYDGVNAPITYVKDVAVNGA